LFVAEILIATSVVYCCGNCIGFVDFFGKRDSSESLQRRKEELQNKIEKKKLRKLGEGSWEWSHWLFLLLLLHLHLWPP
jgi:hypothetical protein